MYAVTANLIPTTPRPVRMLTCTETGQQFAYSGRGRPPLYHPDVAAAKKKQAQRAAAARAAEKRKAASEFAEKVG